MKIPITEFFQNVIRELTTVASLLGGFSFTGMTIILTNSSEVVFSPATFFVCAITTCILVTASIVGVLFSLFHLTARQEIPPVFLIWFVLVFCGIIFFFITVTMLAWSLGTAIGAASAALSTVGVAGIVWAWFVVANAAPPEDK